jgi:Rrf2 family nitric oxide-sensitive transcriptional repressor
VRLTEKTDFGLRVLLYLAVSPDRNIPAEEIARVFQISEHHLVKVAQALVRAGFVETIRGRKGGIRLAQSPDIIRVGAIVRALEPDFQMANCSQCYIASACRLQSVLIRATTAFCTELDRVTLQDLTQDNAPLHTLLVPLPLLA